MSIATACGAVGEPVSDQPVPSMWLFSWQLVSWYGGAEPPHAIVLVNGIQHLGLRHVVLQVDLLSQRFVGPRRVLGRGPSG